MKTVFGAHLTNLLNRKMIDTESQRARDLDYPIPDQLIFGPASLAHPGLELGIICQVLQLTSHQRFSVVQ